MDRAVTGSPVAAPQRSWWGWGYEDRALERNAVTAIGRSLAQRWGVDFDSGAVAVAPRPAELGLRSARVKVPDALRGFVSGDDRERARHAQGKAFVDVVSALHGEVSHPPDWVAFPRDEAEVTMVLDWCGDEGAAVVPFGGGSSVVGGVSCNVGDAHRAAVSLDTSQMGRVLEVDPRSRAARIQAGAFGPDLESQLRPRSLTLRHFPQSFEHSTLGGWIATRAGGHYASNYTHIDDFVESLRVVTPRGAVETRRLPGDGAGPSPDALFLGSEGCLGVITEAWVRLQDRPRYKESASVRFASFLAGAGAVRALSQSGLFPSNCRLLDSGEAAVSAGVADGSAVLIVGFESADHPVDPWMERALQCCADHGGTVPGPETRAHRRAAAGGTDVSDPEGEGDAAAGTWRSSFLAAPYLRDAIAALGHIAETFETAVTWDRFDELHEGVMDAVQGALGAICGGGSVTCRFTHVYPDGPAPYFTVLAPSSHGSQISQWNEIKAAASDAILGSGGTITHHHAVGRFHRPWYDRQRPPLFSDALVAAKKALDPGSIMNPGVLVDSIPSNSPTKGEACAGR